MQHRNATFKVNKIFCPHTALLVESSGSHVIGRVRKKDKNC